MGKVQSNKTKTLNCFSSLAGMNTITSGGNPTAGTSTDSATSPRPARRCYPHPMKMRN